LQVGLVKAGGKVNHLGAGNQVAGQQFSRGNFGQLCLLAGVVAVNIKIVAGAGAAITNGCKILRKPCSALTKCARMLRAVHWPSSPNNSLLPLFRGQGGEKGLGLFRLRSLSFSARDAGVSGMGPPNNKKGYCIFASNCANFSHKWQNSMLLQQGVAAIDGDGLAGNILVFD
jgi:hypothetical protein